MGKLRKRMETRTRAVTTPSISKTVVDTLVNKLAERAVIWKKIGIHNLRKWRRENKDPLLTLAVRILRALKPVLTPEVLDEI